MSLSLRAAVLMPYRAQCNDETGGRAKHAAKLLNKAAINVQQCLFRTARAPCEPAKRQGNTDLRVRPTRERFGAALFALIEEKAIHEVMIRGSARSRQRSAAPLLSSLSKLRRPVLERDGGWTANVEQHSQHQARKSGRLARVAEFFAYVASARKLYHSLVLSGRIQAFFDLA